MTGPHPLPLSLIITMFNMPNLPGSNFNPPSMPSVQGPTFQAPTFQPPSISSSGIQGPYMQGPQVQGPYYSGPSVPGQSSSGRATASEGKHAGLWLGIVIFAWVLAFIALIVLGLYLSGVNINPFNYQRYKAQDAMTAFTTGGLEISRPAAYGTSGGFGTQQPPFSYVDGFNFTIPSSGPTAGGGITSFSSGSEMDKAKIFLSDPTKNGAIPYRIYTKGNIMVYLNVSSEAKAKQYEAALQNMR
jgi:hypothetical protein